MLRPVLNFLEFKDAWAGGMGMGEMENTETPLWRMCAPGPVGRRGFEPVGKKGFFWVQVGKTWAGLQKPGNIE